MRKLTEKEQKLQEALEVVGMERYSFRTRIYHHLHGRISVGRTERFVFTGAYNKGQKIYANQQFDDPQTGRSECIETFLWRSAGIKSTKALFNSILRLEKKMEREYLDDYTRMAYV